MIYFSSLPCRYHSWNATGIIPHKHFPSIIPMIHSCHVFWFGSQFAAAFLSFIALIFVIWTGSRLFSNMLHQRGKTIGSFIAMAWLSSFAFGLGSIWTKTPKMQIAQAAINICIIFANICCGTSLSFNKRQTHTEPMNNNDENSRKQNGSQVLIQGEPCKVVTPGGSIHAENGQVANPETIAEKTKVDESDEIQCACHQAIAFVLCSIFSGKTVLFKQSYICKI